MNNRILFILSIIVIGTNGFYAQDKDTQKVGGLRAGFHSAYMVEEGSKPDTANSLNSFYVGFFRDQKISPLFYFGSGLEYFQNGIKHSSNSKRVLHTLSIPLDLKFKLGPVFALGGAAANFKVAEKIVVGDNSVNPADGNKSNWFDIPVFLGLGVKISFITVEARYHWGLLEVKNGLNSRYLQIGAGISF
jgi:hypothetical protein